MHVITSPTTLRLASLDCDIPVPNVYAERGFYADIFEKLLNDAVRTELKGLEVDVKVTRYDCMRSELPSEKELDDIDGIIITGSGMSSILFILRTGKTAKLIMLEIYSFICIRRRPLGSLSHVFCKR